MNQETQYLDDQEKEEQELCEVVMPGFRFHPTEEELVEFYLRRKVEGKRFNVELITFLDLYRYDPWELPGLAAIGEKEWYFYVPRDKKYRNGDRPNRVTTSGYWKATGADRMIRREPTLHWPQENPRFLLRQGPQGIRTSWIMNEYRLPLHETERLQKAEISICRVYKRAGVEDHPSLPRSLPTTRASSSKISPCEPANNQAPMVKFQTSRGKSPQQTDGKSDETSPTSSTDISNPSFPFSKHNSSYTINTAIPPPPIIASPLEEGPNCVNSSFHHHVINDDLHKLVNISSSNNSNYLNPDQYLNSGGVPNLVSRFSTDLQPAQPQPALSAVRARFRRVSR